MDIYLVLKKTYFRFASTTWNTCRLNTAALAHLVIRIGLQAVLIVFSAGRAGSATRHASMQRKVEGKEKDSVLSNKLCV